MVLLLKVLLQPSVQALIQSDETTQTLMEELLCCIDACKDVIEDYLASNVAYQFLTASHLGAGLSARTKVIANVYGRLRDAVSLRTLASLHESAARIEGQQQQQNQQLVAATACFSALATVPATGTLPPELLSTLTAHLDDVAQRVTAAGNVTTETMRALDASLTAELAATSEQVVRHFDAMGELNETRHGEITTALEKLQTQSSAGATRADTFAVGQNIAALLSNEILPSMAMLQDAQTVELRDALDAVEAQRKADHAEVMRKLDTVVAQQGAPQRAAAPAAADFARFCDELCSRIRKHPAYSLMPFFMDASSFTDEERSFSHNYTPLTVSFDGTKDQYTDLAEAWNAVVDARKEHCAAGGIANRHPLRVLLEAPAGSGKTTAVNLNTIRGHVRCAVVLDFSTFAVRFAKSPTVCTCTAASKPECRCLQSAIVASLEEDGGERWLLGYGGVGTVCDLLSANSHEVLYVLDGYDEVQGLDSNDAVKQLVYGVHSLEAKFASLSFIENVLATTRPERSTKFGTLEPVFPASMFVKLTLEQWDPAAVRSYVAKFPRLALRPERQAVACDLLLSSPNFGAFERRPFVVHVICVAMALLRTVVIESSQQQPAVAPSPGAAPRASGGVVHDASVMEYLRAVAGSPCKIFSIVVEKTLKKRCHDPPPLEKEQIDYEKRRNRLRALSLDLLDIGQSQFALVDDMDRAPDGLNLPACGLLTGHGNQYRFLHKTLMEFLAAEHVILVDNSALSRVQVKPSNGMLLYFLADLLRTAEAEARHRDHSQDQASVAPPLTEKVGAHIGATFIRQFWEKVGKECAKLGIKAERDAVVGMSAENRMAMGQSLCVEPVLTFFHYCRPVCDEARRHRDDPDGTRSAMRRLFHICVEGTKGPVRLLQFLRRPPLWMYLMIEPAARVGSLYALQKLREEGNVPRSALTWAALEAHCSRNAPAVLEFLRKRWEVSVDINMAVEMNHVAAVEAFLAEPQNTTALNVWVLLRKCASRNDRRCATLLLQHVLNKIQPRPSPNLVEMGLRIVLRGDSVALIDAWSESAAFWLATLDAPITSILWVSEFKTVANDCAEVTMHKDASAKLGTIMKLHSTEVALVARIASEQLSTTNHRKISELSQVCLAFALSPESDNSAAQRKGLLHSLASSIVMPSCTRLLHVFRALCCQSAAKELWQALVETEILPLLETNVESPKSLLKSVALSLVAAVLDVLPVALPQLHFPLTGCNIITSKGCETIASTCGAMRPSPLSLSKFPIFDTSLSFTGHGDWVRSVAYSPDGLHVVSGSDDKTVRIWDALSGACELPSLGC